LRENGDRVTVFRALSWEVRGAAQKPLLHLWSEQHNLTRRVLAITDHSDQGLALAVERFGRTRPGRLEFFRLEFDPSARDLCREQSCVRLGRVLSNQFPDETLESLTSPQDLEHSLSGNYARGFLRRGSTRWAVLGVLDNTSSESAENCLTFGLLWLDRARQSGHRGFVAGVRLIVPKGAWRVLVHRLQALNPEINLELNELEPQCKRLEHIDPRSAGNIETWIVPKRESQTLLDQARPAIDPIVALAPAAITVHSVVPSRHVLLRLRGLAFARWDDGAVFLGIAERRQKLTAAPRPALRRLLHDIEAHRHPLASDTRNSFYRAQPEAWLDSLVRKDVTRIDAALDSRFAYTQVFANSHGEHGILDLLTVTRDARLVILELKASEHIHLPLQAADYWLRIRRHLQQGDFPRYGYFTGIELRLVPPLVYLVAPELRFHPTTDVLLRSLSAVMEVVRVGLAESWRRGLRVVNRR
jgi:hypothetical protein